MFDFDIQHIQGSENILADALSRIYDGVKEEELTREDYLQEEQKYLNTDIFLPKNTSSHMPYFSSNHNYDPYITIPLTPSPEPQVPNLVIPELHRQNATLQQTSMNELPNHVPTQASQPSSYANVNLCGSIALPFGDGCTAAQIFWEDCNATGWCEAHLANHIDSYAHRLDGLPKRTFSAHPDGPSSTATKITTLERLPQDALPSWRHPNFPLAPTSTPVQSTYQTHVTAHAADGADYVRWLSWEYIQTGSTRRLPPVVEVQSTNPSQDKQKTEQRQFGHINPDRLQVPNPDPIEYVEWREFWKEWEACSVQFAPTITALPPPPPEEIGSNAVTRGQKCKQEQ